jgi:hypothetical protein
MMAWIALRADTCGLDGVEKRMNSWRRWRGVAADDGSVVEVEGRKQCRRAVALAIVDHGPGATLLHRQTRLGAIERLDLALLIN